MFVCKYLKKIRINTTMTYLSSTLPNTHVRSTGHFPSVCKSVLSARYKCINMNNRFLSFTSRSEIYNALWYFCESSRDVTNHLPFNFIDLMLATNSILAVLKKLKWSWTEVDFNIKILVASCKVARSKVKTKCWGLGGDCCIIVTMPGGSGD